MFPRKDLAIASMLSSILCGYTLGLILLMTECSFFMAVYSLGLAVNFPTLQQSAGIPTLFLDCGWKVTAFSAISRMFFLFQHLDPHDVHL